MKYPFISTFDMKTQLFIVLVLIGLTDTDSALISGGIHGEWEGWGEIALRVVH